MGAQVKLRCWARSADEQLYCDVDDDDHYWHRCGGTQWSDRECAPRAHGLGRETAALRILEVAHEIDRLAFVNMAHSAQATIVRAIAARLMVNAVAVSDDLASLDSEAKTGNGLIAEANAAADKADHADVYLWLEQTVALLAMAADILRPFAESK